MRASRGASLGEAKGPSHSVELVRFEFVGELAELSLLGVLKHVGMQRLEFVSNSALSTSRLSSSASCFLACFLEGSVDHGVTPADLAPRPRVDGLFFGGFCAPRGSRRRAAKASRRCRPGQR